MFKIKRVGPMTVLASALLIAAASVPASASTVSFGAKLTSEQQADGRQSCTNASPGNIPSGAVCTWVAREAVGNGNKFKAPKNGTLHKLRLISCNAGKFTLQLVKLNAQGKAKVDHTGPVINYQADPRQVDSDENTQCGGDNGDDYIIQVFNINVGVTTGDYIAVKAQKLGVLHCSGQSMDLYSPPLASGQGFRSAAGDTGCGLLVRLSY
jgi:hypothetical protein